jgi:hypothetical protein
MADINMDNNAPTNNGINGIHNNDDDISVNTVEAKNLIIVNSGERKEYVVKFLFRPTNESGNSEVARTHFNILKTIYDNYPDETTIFDNYGSTMKEFKNPKTYDQYLRHFKLQYVKGNKYKNRNPIYLAFHRLQSTVPISEIRKHHVIAALLQKVNTRLTTHNWKEDETRIATLGFFVGVDPGNHLKEDFEERIKSAIATATRRTKKNIPRFQCGFTSPFVITADKNRIATKSYDFQCRQKDAKELIQLLQTTYQANPSFIFHKLRHKNLPAYTNAIRKQNSLLANSRVVPIQGVNEDQMFSLENELLQVDGIKEILRHKETHSRGRWSIMTTEAFFKPIVAELSAHLPDWVQFYATEFPSDEDFPAPGLAFKNQPFEEGSEGSFNTYMSACSSIYTIQDDTFDLPPERSNAITQAWGGDPVPALLDSTVSTPANSGISQDDFDAVNRENARLNRKLDELTVLVKNMQQSHQTPQQPSQIDMNIIIAAATQAALQAVAAAQLQREHVPLVIHDDAPPPSNRDMSFDSLEEDDDLTANQG